MATATLARRNLPSDRSAPSLGKETIKLCVRLKEAHTEHSAVKERMQVLFLNTFRGALEDVGGPHWHDASKGEGGGLEEHFDAAKGLVWAQIKGSFDRPTFDSYFSTIKKCLIYDLDNWAFCKRTSVALFERALCVLDENENPSKRGHKPTYYHNEVSYQDGLMRAVNFVKAADEQSKESQKSNEASTDIGSGFQVPSSNGLSDVEWCNEVLIWIRMLFTKPNLAPKIKGKDPRQKFLREVVLEGAQKHLVERQNGHKVLPMRPANTQDE